MNEWMDPIQSYQVFWNLFSFFYFLLYLSLYQFCMNNATNQAALSKFTDFMVDQRIRYRHIENIIDTIIEM